MSWLVVEIWRTIRDTWRAKQESGWQDKLIDLKAEKEISRIRASTARSRSKLIEATTELHKAKANYIWSKIPTKEDAKNGASGNSEEGKGKATAGKHS